MRVVGSTSGASMSSANESKIEVPILTAPKAGSESADFTAIDWPEALDLLLRLYFEHAEVRRACA